MINVVLTILAPSCVRKSKDPSPGTAEISKLLFRVPDPRLTQVRRIEIRSPIRHDVGRSKLDRRYPPSVRVCPRIDDIPVEAIFFFSKMLNVLKKLFCIVLAYTGLTNSVLIFVLK